MIQIRFNNPPQTLWGNTLYGFTIEDDFDLHDLYQMIRVQHGQFSLETINQMITDLVRGDYSEVSDLDVIWIY